MKKMILTAFACLALAIAAQAQETPTWIRRNAISPDGKTLAFSYKGDIFTVPTAGGEARQITSNRAYETDPFWTADGQKLVFSSWREGSKDLYMSGKEGGVPTRLTTLPGNETPLAVTADGTIYFTWQDSNLMSPGFDGFPGDPALYKTNLEGKAPELVTSLTLSAMSHERKCPGRYPVRGLEGLRGSAPQAPHFLRHARHLAVQARQARYHRRKRLIQNDFHV